MQLVGGDADVDSALGQLDDEQATQDSEKFAGMFAERIVGQIVPGLLGRDLFGFPVEEKIPGPMVPNIYMSEPEKDELMESLQPLRRRLHTVLFTLSQSLRARTPRRTTR